MPLCAVRLWFRVGSAREQTCRDGVCGGGATRRRLLLVFLLLWAKV